MNPKKSSVSDALVKAEEVSEVEIIESREAPLQRSIETTDVIQSAMNEAQLSILLNKTPEYAIKKRQGGSGKMLSYVPHGYVTDVLNKAFGFDWDLILDPMSEGKMYAYETEEVFNAKTGALMKTNRHVAVCGHLVVRIHNEDGSIKATITKSGFGSQLWLPTMELGDALKAASSDLLKVCAYKLGVALDLYWNERAEVEGFVTAQRENETKKEAEEKLKRYEKSGYPMNFSALLSKTKSDYGITGAQVEEILSVEIDALMDYTPEQIVDCWNKITAFASKKEA